MTKYFELLLDLLEIHDKDPYIEIAKIIEGNTDKKLKVHHQYFFIFEWYRDLLDWKLSPEEFLQLWDINSKLRFDSKKLDSISFLQSNPDFDDDTIYIFDSLSDWIIQPRENVFYV